MNEVNLNIQKARESKGYSYSELSNITNIPKSTLQRYEMGTTKKIPMEAIGVIEEALYLPKGFLMGWQDDDGLKEPEITENVVSFPVIGTIAAGYDEIAIEDWTGDTVEIPLSYIRGRSASEFFVLSVHGNSMYPLYTNGDKVLVLKQSALNRSGDIGAIIYENDCATLKKIEYVDGGDWLKLVPLNPEYQPKLLTDVQLEECRIIGVPFLLIRDLHK